MNATTPPSLVIDVVDTGDTVLFRVRGELDLRTGPRLDRALTPFHARCCELDLAEVPFTDSTGVNLLVRNHRNAARAGGSLRIVSVTRPVLRVLRLTGTAAILLAGDGPPEEPGVC
ncbi:MULTISPECIES: STAS domain-containing protein [unclassified Streptomyces]|uniref:STAS domain-containing protein n=1 Tax=unclassified Streptomyces TaxID=2593676 RepID=UPI000DC55A98|nr:STAS domain-containing protein [Streptomyces sp. PsTaAH-137]MYT75374.1 anti-sigma factor antagonist [Streptomyces sp. SID8367]RAJ86776.1 anti-anti-sigma factor [Streptomyces sp. PsTaAH-137]